MNKKNYLNLPIKKYRCSLHKQPTEISLRERRGIWQPVFIARMTWNFAARFAASDPAMTSVGFNQEINKNDLVKKNETILKQKRENFSTLDSKIFL